MTLLFTEARILLLEAGSTQVEMDRSQQQSRQALRRQAPRKQALRKFALR